MKHARIALTLLAAALAITLTGAWGCAVTAHGTGVFTTSCHISHGGHTATSVLKNAGGNSAAVTRIQVKIMHSSGTNMGTVQKDYKHPRHFDALQTRRLRAGLHFLSKPNQCQVTGVWYTP